MLTGFPSVYPEVQEASSKGRLAWSVEGLSEGLDYIDQHGNEGANHFAIQFLIRKYGWERGMCHSWRLGQAMEFWSDFRDRLIEVKLIIPEGEFDGIDRNLLQVLSVCPFTKPVEGTDGKEWSFDFDEVLLRVRELQGN